MFSFSTVNPKVKVSRIDNGVLLVNITKDYDSIVLYFESDEDFERSFRIPEKIDEEVKVGGTN